MPRVAVVCYTTDLEYPALEWFHASLKRHRWPAPVVLHAGESFAGHPEKLRVVKDELPKLKARGYTHALYTDCWDVLCCGPFHEVEDACETGETLLSADAGIWSADDVRSEMFPDVGSRWKYVNGGGWLGDIDHLLDVVLDGSERECVNDQWHLSRKWIAQVPGLKLDSKCDVFQCLSQCPRECFDVDPDDYVHNLETHSLPLLVHGAGGADMSWVPSPVPWRPIARS